jgi:hypothetical protein
MSDCRRRPPLVVLASLLLTTGFTDQPSASLRISLDRTACAAIDEMSVHKVVTTPTDNSGGKIIERSQVGQSPVTPDCAWTLAGLAPGEYEVWFHRAGVKLADRPVTIGPDEPAEVMLTHDVLVSGAVLLNGVAFQGVAVEFSQGHGSHRQLAGAVTDATGNYQVFLAEEGPYKVVFRRETTVVLGQDHEGVAHKGANRADWLLEGATLKVMPVGWDRIQPMSLWIERVDHTGQTYGTTVALKAERLPLTLVGLGWGTYELSWVDTDTHRSSPTRLSIDAQNSEPSVQLAVAAGSIPRF